MRVIVQLFAQAREKVGRDRLELALPEGARCADLPAAIAAAAPALRPLAGSARFAVALEYVLDDHPLRDGDHVAMIPPVSGG